VNRTRPACRAAARVALDSLRTADGAGLPATATMTADTIAVSAAGHTYKLQAVASY